MWTSPRDVQPCGTDVWSAHAGANGETLTIKGVNWFGFETSSTMTDGLWQGPNAITQNFEAVVWRIKLMGFNTVRIPFSFQVSCSHCCTHSCISHEWIPYPRFARVAHNVAMRNAVAMPSSSSKKIGDPATKRLSRGCQDSFCQPRDSAASE